MAHTKIDWDVRASQSESHILWARYIPLHMLRMHCKKLRRESYSNHHQWYAYLEKFPALKSSLPLSFSVAASPSIFDSRARAR